MEDICNHVDILFISVRPKLTRSYGPFNKSMPPSPGLPRSRIVTGKSPTAILISALNEQHPRAGSLSAA